MGPIILGRMTRRKAKHALRTQLAYVQLDRNDAMRLRALRPAIEAHAYEVVDAFYEHLFRFERPRALLRDPAVRARLREAQRDYLLGLTIGIWDEAFVDRRIAIGRAHDRVGLEPQWYLGAYSLYIGLLTPIIQEVYADEPDQATLAQLSLVKILMLDGQLAMTAYIDAGQAKLEIANSELEAAGLGLARKVHAQSQDLRDTRARAEAAEQLASLGTIAAGLAHEIGTPMGVIAGHAESLERSVSDDRGLWRLRTIREQIDRVSRIMNALLNFARPRQLDHAETDLQTVIKTALSFLTEKIRRRGIEVQTDIAAGATVWGDAEKLQQLFLNLFINAADSMQDGGTLLVTTPAVEGNTIEVVIRDTGVGIPAQDLGRIFEPFFTSKEASHGSGLGLPVVSSIIGEHGGAIEVESEPGKGTTVWLTFEKYVS